MNLPQLLLPLLLSAAVALLLSFLFYFISIKSTKKKIRKEYEEAFRNHQLKLQEELQVVMNEYTQKLISENVKEITAYKMQLREALAAEAEQHKTELRKNNEFEVQVLRAKIKNVQSSYPRKIEAQQKLAVLTDSILSGTNPSDRESLLTVAQNFEKGEELISKFLLEYAGIIEPSVEENLSRCMACCEEGKKEIESYTSPERILELAEALANNLLQAKRQTKREAAFAK